jgi:hypothetical protein
MCTGFLKTNSKLPEYFNDYYNQHEIAVKEGNRLTIYLYYVTETQLEHRINTYTQYRNIQCILL